GGCVGNETRGEHRFFDLRGADATPRSLDHLVAAADEIEEAFGISLHRVTGPNGHLRKHEAAVLSRHGFEPLAGLGRIVPVAEPNERAAVNELAGLVGRTLRAVRADYENLGVRDRLAY